MDRISAAVTSTEAALPWFLPSLQNSLPLSLHITILSFLSSPPRSLLLSLTGQSGVGCVCVCVCVHACVCNSDSLQPNWTVAAFKHYRNNFSQHQRFLSLLPTPFYFSPFCSPPFPFSLHLLPFTSCLLCQLISPTAHLSCKLWKNVSCECNDYVAWHHWMWAQQGSCDAVRREAFVFLAGDIWEKQCVAKHGWFVSLLLKRAPLSHEGCASHTQPYAHACTHTHLELYQSVHSLNIASEHFCSLKVRAQRQTET